MTQKRFWEVLRSLPRKGWILSFSAEFPYALRLKDKPQSQRSFSPIEAVCLVEKGKLLNEDTGAVEFLEIDADFLAEIGWAAAYGGARRGFVAL